LSTNYECPHPAFLSLRRASGYTSYRICRINCWARSWVGLAKKCSGEPSSRITP